MVTFGIITDTHIRVPGGDLSSPFPVNDRANGRARYAVELLARQSPELTIHLGDLVHPLPHMAAYQPAAAEAKRILAPLPQLHVVPGNHDIGDKPSPGMPAKSSTADSVAVYQAEFGTDRSAFRHTGVLFVIMNSSLVNSGLAREAEQRAWLEKTLRAAKGERILLFSHYPPFICTPDEQDHYDNYAEPGRSWLLELAAETGVEAIFSGHVHHFFYNRYKGVKLFCQPPTSFTRQDYAEMFPVAPAPEFGRDDRGKFGVALVDVLDPGLRFRWFGTDGCELAEGREFQPSQLPAQYPGLVPHLRHAWFEPRSLPYNGPMEEFSRKRARNDYPLLRLMQLGIKTVRTPLSDLADPIGAARIADWRALGQRFVFFRIGLPAEDEVTALAGLGEAVDAVEVLSSRADAGDILARLPDTMAQSPVPVWLSKITTSADTPRADGVFAHSVSSGFLPGQVSDLIDALGPCRPAAIVVQFQCTGETAGQIAATADKLSRTGLRLVANLRLSDPNPALPSDDDVVLQRTLRAALATVERIPGATLQCDTFEDVDRGYHPRNGLVDRLGNLRVGG